MPAESARRLIAMALLVSVAVGPLAACEPAAPERLPGHHGLAVTPLVYVYGDSLTPVADYRAQAATSGYRLVSEATSGSWMCGGYEIPQADATRWWPRIMATIAEVRPDFIVLEYQGWANYQLRCGGRPAAFPYSPADPGQGWRVYLDMFVDAIIAAGGRTRLVVVESPGAPADLRAWVEPQRIMDQASRTMAARRPGWITFVPIRQDLMPGGRWSAFAPCKPYETGPSERGAGPSCWARNRAADWPAGQVRIRSGDRIHYWCPTGGGVCATSTPAGLRIRRALFDVLNRLTAYP